MTRKGRAMARKIYTVPYTYVKCDNPFCGKEFYGQRSTAKYCSNGCKQAEHRARKKREAEVDAEAKKSQMGLGI